MFAKPSRFVVGVCGLSATLMAVLAVSVNGDTCMFPAECKPFTCKETRPVPAPGPYQTMPADEFVCAATNDATISFCTWSQYTPETASCRIPLNPGIRPCTLIKYQRIQDPDGTWWYLEMADELAQPVPCDYNLQSCSGPC